MEMEFPLVCTLLSAIPLVGQSVVKQVQVLCKEKGQNKPGSC